MCQGDQAGFFDASAVLLHPLLREMAASFSS